MSRHRRGDGLTDASPSGSVGQGDQRARLTRSSPGPRAGTPAEAITPTLPGERDGHALLAHVPAIGQHRSPAPRGQVAARRWRSRGGAPRHRHADGAVRDRQAGEGPRADDQHDLAIGLRRSDRLDHAAPGDDPGREPAVDEAGSRQPGSTRSARHPPPAGRHRPLDHDDRDPVEQPEHTGSSGAPVRGGWRPSSTAGLARAGRPWEPRERRARSSRLTGVTARPATTHARSPRSRWATGEDAGRGDGASARGRCATSRSARRHPAPVVQPVARRSRRCARAVDRSTNGPSGPWPRPEARAPTTARPTSVAGRPNCCSATRRTLGTLSVNATPAATSPDERRRSQAQQTQGGADAEAGQVRAERDHLTAERFGVGRMVDALVDEAGVREVEQARPPPRGDQVTDRDGSRLVADHDPVHGRVELGPPDAVDGDQTLGDGVGEALHHLRVHRPGLDVGAAVALPDAPSVAQPEAAAGQVDRAPRRRRRGRRARHRFAPIRRGRCRGDRPRHHRRLRPCALARHHGTSAPILGTGRHSAIRPWAPSSARCSDRVHPPDAGGRPVRQAGLRTWCVDRHLGGTHMPLIIALLELAGTVLAWQDERRLIRTR